MPKRNLSDIVLQQIKAPEYIEDFSIDKLADILIRRLGIKRKESKANHKKFFLELLKERYPIPFIDVSRILGVSQSQTYEELRKWRTLGLVKFSNVVDENGNKRKGYALVTNDMKKLIDIVRDVLNKFMNETEEIALNFEKLYKKDTN